MSDNHHSNRKSNKDSSMYPESHRVVEKAPAISDFLGTLMIWMLTFSIFLKGFEHFFPFPENPDGVITSWLLFELGLTILNFLWAPIIIVILLVVKNR